MNKGVLRHWPIYLGIAAAMSLATVMAVSFRCRVKDTERVFVFAAVPNIDLATFVEEGKKATDESIREIEIKQGKPESNDTANLFGMVYPLADLYLCPTSWVERILPYAYSFSGEQCETSLPNANGNLAYEKEGEYRAIRIYDHETKSGKMTSLLEYGPEEDYYLLFRGDSKHIGDWNGEKSSNALKMMNHLLEI